MGRLTWYKRYPLNALEGMMELSLEERGAYNTVLDLIYTHDGRLDDDERFIAGWLRVDVRVWRRIRTRLVELGKLQIDDAGSLVNDRATSEVDAALCRAVSASDAGKVSAQKRNAAKSKNNGLAATDVQRPLQPYKKTELELELELESPSKTKSVESPPSPPGGGAKVLDFPKAKRAKRTAEATLIPDNFRLSEDMAAYAAEKANWDGGRAAAEFERFCSHHRFKGTRGRNWAAGWQLWARNGAKFDAERPQSRGTQIVHPGQI
jgi:uncharacterized protein YdaU (DUF1376 family)